MNGQAERALRRIPEVSTVVSKTGAAELATDPMGPDVSDIFVELRDPSEWRPGMTKEDLVHEMEEALSTVPGMSYSFSQPIELRVNELISGVRSDVAIKLFGDDLEVLRDRATRIAEVMGRIRGAEDVRVEQTAGLPQAVVRFNRVALARYGITIAEAAEALETAFGGSGAGEVFEGDRRFDLVVRLAPSARSEIEDVGRSVTTRTARGPRSQTQAMAGSGRSTPAVATTSPWWTTHGARSRRGALPTGYHPE